MRSCVGDRRDPAVVEARRWMAELILQVRRGEQELESTTLNDVVYGASTARALISAATRHSDEAELSGEIGDSLSLTRRISGSVKLRGRVRGSLSVRAPIMGDLFVNGEIDGDLTVSDVVIGTLYVRGKIGGSLRVAGEIGSHLSVSGEVGRNLRIDGKIGRDLLVLEKVGIDLVVDGEVGRHVSVTGEIGRHLFVAGTISGNLGVAGEASIGSDLMLRGRVAGDLLLYGRFGGSIDLTEIVCAGRTILAPREREEPVKLASVRSARFGDEVFVGDNVSIAFCDFRQCSDLDRLLLVGAHLFPSGARGLRNPPEGEQEPVSLREMATINRQLRTNLEGRGNRPNAAIFYRGEMDARRRAAHSERQWGEWSILAAYRAMSGYGLRAWRAVAWFVALVVIGSWLYSTTNPGFQPYAARNPLNFAATLQFSLESMLGLLRSPGDQLGVAGRWLQIAQRIVGPIFITLAGLAIRERVAR